MIRAGGLPKAQRGGSGPAAGDLPLAFEELIWTLRSRGLPLGVDHVLRVGALLGSLEEPCPPEELADHFAPILASDARQQAEVHRAFAELYPRFARPLPSVEREDAASEPPPAEVRPARWAPRRAIRGIAIALGGLALAFAIWRGWPEPVGRGVAPPQAARVEEASANGRRPSPAGSESRSVGIAPPGRRDVVHSPWARLGWASIPLVVLAGALLWRLVGRRFVLRKTLASSPPFVWPLLLPPPDRALLPWEEIRATARSLRRRFEGPVQRLDVGRSVRATCRHAGRITLAFRGVSDLPGYLALIEERSRGDHGAGLARELFRVLADEGLHVRICSFETDPGVCRSEEGAFVSIEELHDRHGQDRLLLWTVGERALDPVSGGPALWTRQLQRWEDRAVVSSRDPRRWGRTEKVLAGLGPVFPGSFEGLRALGDYFEASSMPPPFLPDRSEGVEGEERESLDAEAVVARLRRELSPAAFVWLCACAVHPELQWGLTLHLSRLPELGSEILTEGNLLQLTRLPWFREGEIPGAIRLALVRQLTPVQEAAIRGQLVRALEASDPPAGSVADESRIVELALHRTWIDGVKSRGASRHLRSLRRLPRSRWRRDPVAWSVLQTFRTSPLDWVVPRQLARRLGGRMRSGLLAPALLAVLASAGIWWGLAPDEHTTVVGRLDRLPVVSSPSARFGPLPDEPPPTEPLDSSDSITEEAGSSEPPAPSPSTASASAVAERPEALPERHGPVVSLPSEGESGTEPSVTEPLSPARTSPRVDAIAAPESEPVTASTEPPARTAAPLPAEGEDRLAASPPVGGEVPITVRVPLEPSGAAGPRELTLDRYLRPVDFRRLRVEVERTRRGRGRVLLEIDVSSADGAAYLAHVGARLLDAEGRGVMSKSQSERLAGGDQTLELSFDLPGPSFEKLAELRLEMDVEYAPGAIRRLLDGFSQTPDELPRLAPEQLEVTEQGARLRISPDAGELRVDRLVRPIDLERISTRREGGRITFAIWVANPSAEDQRVVVSVSLLDGEGRLVAEKSDRRVVEEGEKDRKLGIRWRLAPEELAAIDSLWIEVSATPD